MRKTIATYETFPMRSDGGFEQYTKSKIIITEQEIEKYNLDTTGRKTLRRHCGESDGCAFFLAFATISWKSDLDRLHCMQNQMSRDGNGVNSRGKSNTRWDNVVDFAIQMCKNEWRYHEKPPAFAHPSIVHKETCLLPLDGARTIMASLEAGIAMLPVTVIRKVDETK